MSRRSGQNGRVEKKGKNYYTRFWLDVPGQAKRTYKSVGICPVSGPGSLKKFELKRRVKEIIAEFDANSETVFKQAEAINLGTTFKEQAERWLQTAQTRKRNSILTSANMSSSVVRLKISASLSATPHVLRVRVNQAGKKRVAGGLDCFHVRGGFEVLAYRLDLPALDPDISLIQDLVAIENVGVRMTKVLMVFALASKKTGADSSRKKAIQPDT